MQVKYRLDQNTSPPHVITVKASWRKLPHVLEVMREIPLDIRRAYIHQDVGTFYVNSGSPYLSPEDIQKSAGALEMQSKQHASGISSVASSLFTPPPRIELPVDSKVLLYNFPDVPYTTMEFSCKDRVGLLSDLLQFMSGMPIEIRDAIITTMGEQAHNILHLQSKGDSLGFHQISYIRNVFEYDIKPRFVDNDQELM